ncbi:hypothetical protein K9M59_01710 [Candidatus Gracilibacteria bacterium]|nr:hypothetical protein [Candidatus Gracilibacteria bacterium]MCF7819748.1 hypothetical protein [Candidatus Gracilibacteria bacterium]
MSETKKLNIPNVEEYLSSDNIDDVRKGLLSAADMGSTEYLPAIERILKNENLSAVHKEAEEVKTYLEQVKNNVENVINSSTAV